MTFKGAKMAAQQTFAFFQPSVPAEKPAEERTRTPTGKRSVGGAGKIATAKRDPTKERPPTQIRVAKPATSPVPSASEPVLSEPFLSEPADTASILKKLRRQVGCVSTAADQKHEVRSAGCSAIDDLLPSGGLRTDALTEWVTPATNSSAGVFSLLAAAGQLRHLPATAPLVVIDTDHQFYPPAAVALGISIDQIILVRTKRQADIVWAIDQALRCAAVGAVWAKVGSWLDDRDARRFQLAAESGKTPGLLVRPTAVRGRPSFADVRFHVDQLPLSAIPAINRSQTPASSLLARVTVDRCRGGATGQNVLLSIDDQARMTPISTTPLVKTPLRPSQPAAHHDTAPSAQTAAVHLANQLASPTPTDESDKRHEQPSEKREQRRA